MLSSISSSLLSTWADTLFAKLDTKNQGYIDKSELESAFSNIDDNSDSSASVSVHSIATGVSERCYNKHWGHR